MGGVLIYPPYTFEVDILDSKECSKQYYIKNREKILEKDKQDRDNNPEKERERHRKYYKEHSESRKEKSKEWRKNNPGYIKEWRKNNPEYAKQWQKTDKGKANKQRSKTKRRAIEKEIINTLTAKEWIDILKEYKFRCAYCGKEFTLFDRETRDHVIPISKGGDNTKENIVPACQSCNSKKSNKRWNK